MTVLLWVCAVAAAALAGHAAVNTGLLRRTAPDPATVDFPVAVLLPVRDEAHRVAPCLRSLLAQRCVPGLRILILDDGSTDGTADVVHAVAAGDPRVQLISGAPLPPGWLGKPHACQQLADAATGRGTGAAAGQQSGAAPVPGCDVAAGTTGADTTGADTTGADTTGADTTGADTTDAGTTVPVLVFVDADVVLAPDAVAAAVALLPGFDLVCPFPRIVAGSAGERLVQPLLQWSWLSFVPLRALERTRHPSLAAAGGQFLVVSTEGYRRAGGHAAVRDKVLEDIELARAVIRSGGRTALADGTPLASCRMYRSWRELSDGYTKSLWAAFGSRAGAVAVAAMLLALYVLPLLAFPVAAVLAATAPATPATPATAGPAWLSGIAPGSWLTGPSAACLAALLGYASGVAGRIVAGRTTGARVWPDALAHPASILLFCVLLARSWRARRRGELLWKGRPVNGPAPH